MEITSNKIRAQVLAQVLYDLCAETGFCSGNDLSVFFADECGDPAPAGCTRVSCDAAAEFLVRAIGDMLHNSPTTGEKVHLEVVEYLGVTNPESTR